MEKPPGIAGGRDFLQVTCPSRHTTNSVNANWFNQVIAEKTGVLASERGTGIRGLLRGMANLPQGNQELLVVKDKVGRPQVSLG